MILPSFLIQSPHVIYASSVIKAKQEKSFRTDFNPFVICCHQFFFSPRISHYLDDDVWKKKYSNSSDPAILKLWPTQILRRTLSLLPSETQRGGRDSEIQVGSSQDNIVESFTKCAHILLFKELDAQIPIPLLTKFYFGLVSKILGWIKIESNIKIQ